MRGWKEIEFNSINIPKDTTPKKLFVMINWGKMNQRINCFTILVDFKVKMGGRGLPSATRECNDLRFSYKLARLNKQVITVCIKSNKSIAMINAYCLSISTFPS